jgi:hypothetical protein
MSRLASFAHLNDVAVNNMYYSWLCDLVGTEYKGRGYCLLLKALHHKNFFWSVPNDDNRAFEGKELRCKFCEENDIFYEYDQYSPATSMLELMVALAFRCENIMSGQSKNRDMRSWFWEILENCGLDRYSDCDYYDHYEGGSIDNILEKIIKRGYRRDGSGGLFPLRKPKKDQRKVELWYQMSAYLVENYYNE